MGTLYIALLTPSRETEPESLGHFQFDNEVRFLKYFFFSLLRYICVALYCDSVLSLSLFPDFSIPKFTWYDLSPVFHLFRDHHTDRRIMVINRQQKCHANINDLPNWYSRLKYEATEICTLYFRNIKLLNAQSQRLYQISYHQLFLIKFSG